MESKEKLVDILNDVTKQYKNGNLTRTLGEDAKSYMGVVIATELSNLQSKVTEVDESIKKLSEVGLEEDFVDGVLESNLQYISDHVRFEVTLDKIHKLLSRCVIDDVSSFNDTGLSGQISKSEMDKFAGREDFDYSNYTGLSISTSSPSKQRTRTSSDEFKVVYDKNSDTYPYKIIDLFKSNNENETPNVFTLKDIADDKKFLNIDGNLEKLTTLGINIISFLGLKKPTGDTVSDRQDSDYICYSSNARYDIVTLRQLVNNPSVHSKYITISLLLPSFVRALSKFGYEDNIWQFFEGLIDRVSENKGNINNDDDDFIRYLKYIPSKNKNELKGYRKIMEHCGVCLCYTNKVLPKKETVFTLITGVLDLISKIYGYNLDELLSSITFYGGHDYVNQGDDINNYFNEVIARGTDTDNFIQYRESTFEKKLKYNKVSRIRFTYKGHQSILLPRKSVRSKDYFCNGDIVYLVLGELLKNRVSIDDIISAIDQYMFTTESIHDEGHSSGYHLDLGDGRYFYDNGNIGVPQVVSALKALFSLKLGFKLEFEFKSKK